MSRHNWKQRRVAFVVADSHHTIKLINVKMPVRIKEIGAEDTIFEGPINAMWERLPIEQKSQPFDTRTEALDLVGVLIANDLADYPGRINWLQQSEIDRTEAGAEYINRQLSEATA